MSEYAKEFSKAKRELDDLLKLRDELDRKIARQQRRMAALAQLNEDESQSDSADFMIEGLTDAVSSVLKASAPRGLSTKEIRTKLIQLYFPVHGYRNFRASLHTTLRRLTTANHVTRLSDSEDGEAKYFWRPKLNLSNRLRGRFSKK